MAKDIDFAYHWPRIAVVFFSFSGILLGFDKFLRNGIIDAIMNFYFSFSYEWSAYVTGSIIILLNLISLFAALKCTPGSASLAVNVLTIHFFFSPFLWFLVIEHWPWNHGDVSWFETLVHLLIQFLFLCLRAWATVVMWRDTRGLARNVWGGLVNEQDIGATTVLPVHAQPVHLT